MPWLPSPQMNQPSLINGNYSCSDGRSLSAGKLEVFLNNAESKNVG
jgi:hypothetical protein